MAGSGCLNCGAGLVGPFCHACGQKDYDPRKSLWTLLRDGLSETFEVDGRLPRTVFALLFQPGRFVQTFMEGKRRSWSSPVRIYIFCLAAAFLAVSLGGSFRLTGDAAEAPVVVHDRPDQGIGLEIGNEGIQISFDADADDDSLTEKGIRRLAERENSGDVAGLLLRQFVEEAPKVVTALLLAFVVLLKAAFPRRFLVEHLLFSVAMHTRALVALAIYAALPFSAVLWVLWGWLHLHALIGLKVVYDLSWPRTLLAYLGVGALYLVLGVFGLIGAVVLALVQLGSAP